jgi:adenylate cyclase
MRYNFACVLSSHLNDAERAIDMLETTLSIAGAHQVRIADVDPDLDHIRDDPRFQKMIAAAKKRHGIADSPPPPAAQAAEQGA